jgi:unsaturated rhamnogalacturonyl hydrolase
MPLTRTYSLLLLSAALLAPTIVFGETTPAVMRRVFDWQAAHPWSAPHPVTSSEGNRGWVQGAFLTGVMEAWRATNDEAYLNYARATAEANGWQPGPRPRHADDHIVGQTYLELYELVPAPEKIAGIQAVLDQIVAAPVAGREFWSWCDALYMSPPTFAKLARVTHDHRYLDAMDGYYWDTYLALYDPAERLFYRDKRFVFPADGPKIFWSRGNGWVIAGLARLLDVLPADHPSRPRYVALFQAMAARLVALQPADGLWRSNLLHPEDQHGEVSGSAFFCYALAWGINHGILPPENYRPAVDRTWTALLGCVVADGRLGWVQPIGAAPGAYDSTTWQEYGSGAFLAAGSQVMQLK